MRFSIGTKHGKKYKEKFSIMRNNISEACRAFNEILPDKDEEYLIKVVKPITFYYDLNGNLMDSENNENI